MSTSSPNEPDEEEEPAEVVSIGMPLAIFGSAVMLGLFVLQYSLLASYGYFTLIGFTALGMAARAIPDGHERVRGLNRFQLTLHWVSVLPLLCLGYVSSFVLAPAAPVGWFDYLTLFIIFQAVFFLIWMFVGLRGPAWNGFFCGFTFFGRVLAGGLALVMFLPASLLAIVFGLGLPGLVPLMAYLVFRAHKKLVYACAGDGPEFKNPFRRAVLRGACYSLLFPFVYVQWAPQYGLPYRLPRVELIPFASYALWKHEK